MGKCLSTEKKEIPSSREGSVTVDMMKGGHQVGGQVVVVAKSTVTKGGDSPRVSSKVSTNVVTKGSPQGSVGNTPSPASGQRHVVSKTIQIKGNGSSGKLPTFSQRFEINNHGFTTAGLRQKSAGPSPTTSVRQKSTGKPSPTTSLRQKSTGPSPTSSLKQKSTGSPSTIKVLVKDGAKQVPINTGSSRSRMGKTTTTTEKKTYTKDGKVFEDEIVTTVVEDDEGTKTSKKTTTRHIGEADSFDFSKVKKELPKEKKSRRSSSSSSDSDDGKKTKSKSKSGGAKGLLGKLKAKTQRSHSSSDSDSSDDEDFAEAAHKEINIIRKNHGVDKLKLSKDMCKYAKEWAGKLAKDEKMSQRPDGKYGENIYCISSNQKTFKVKAKEVTDHWYGQSKEHVFGKEPEGTTLKSGHFTQLVWKDSKQMGIGKARSASGLKIFIVANFDPQGNWMGQFATQVPPVGGFPKPTKTSSKASSKARRDSSSSSSSDSSSDEEDFIEDCIKSHNDYRKKHGVQPLKKSKKLNKHAKDWAKTIAKKDTMEHRSNNEYGENIYCAWSTNPKHKIKGNEGVDSWYSEIKDFTFGKEPADLRAGHFTQVVWEDSKEIGVGMARAKSGKIYVVANYSPAGNYVGSFSSKVHKNK